MCDDPAIDKPAKLLTPGPITTTASVKKAMLKDWGSWDSDFSELTASLCCQLTDIANAGSSHVCVPVQGSGTFAVEATLGTLVGPEDKVLVLANGAYGQRIAAILSRLRRPFVLLDKGDYEPPRAEDVRAALAADPEITQVALVHCETSSGILNPLEEIAELVEREGRSLIIDAMSSFGAIPVDAQRIRFDALISSMNKCLEGVPGFAFALIRETVLQQAEGRAHSLSLDLYDQWRYLQRSGQWRYTPPTHVVAAALQAVKEHAEEGGVEGRLARYSRNRDLLVSGMRGLGFETLLDDNWLSPVIITFLSPADEHFVFARFYAAMKKRGFIIYPGKLTQAETFRLGVIGQLYSEDIKELLDAVSAALDEMNITLPNRVSNATQA
ncbi:2-aminoethylphosphonate--pyruvate transaminase [Marinobacterium lutimaris]|uniref:2-aminoethylphosphonate--pyruvate transaminase n=1 Tax=Marinobacterium lutimaris TaxID=568106 RepID=A0A1H5XG37_9GAMM|nr:2-aminoethylphosphonate--pyruvate transaminase [Marinobacterium lutimaris]SEG10380.1 2-aminoethylphosphonate-pyruvate transaminase [Marinobacterium lutimaris]